MRRLFLVVVLGVALSAGFAHAAGPKDYARGSGTSLVGPAFSFNAWSDPANNDPQGTMKFEDGGVTYFATVTCLAVSGPFATIWGDITKVSGGTTLQDGLVFQAADVSDSDGGDFFAGALQPESLGAGECVPPVAFFRLEDGDITVIDE